MLLANVDIASYSARARAIKRAVEQQEDPLPLVSPAFRSQLRLHGRPTPKVCLFFHGFTAGPWQFEALSQEFYRSGYNVLVPLLPGHGQAGQWGLGQPPPLPTQPKRYLKFAVQWLRIARQLGQQVIVGGLSGGGSLATWLAIDRPQSVAKALLFAPYVSSSLKVVDLFMKPLGEYCVWHRTTAGYTGFDLAALQAFLRIGQYNMRHAYEQSVAPMFVISSESDKAVGNFDHDLLFQFGLQHQPNCWFYRFANVLDIPHGMMNEGEGNRYRRSLTAIARAYIESDLTWAEVEEIGYWMSQGKSFEKVVEGLHLGAQVSRDLPTLMRMMDITAIAIQKELRFKRRYRRV